MKKRIIIFLVGGFFYMCLLLLWGRQYNIVKANAMEIKDYYDGYTPLYVEDEMDSYTVLSDNIGYIGEVNELESQEDNQEDNQDSTTGDNISSDMSDNEEVMSNDQFRIMVIFCFGLCAGVVVGHFLTGFIK